MKFPIFIGNLPLIMKSLVAFFRLIRWPNLLMIALTQWMVWQFVLYPMQPRMEGGLFLDGFRFGLLCLSTVFIAAAGYIINDYFDVRIDVINKPDRVIIEKVISRRLAILLHTALNLSGLLLALYLAWQLRNPWLPLIQLACTILLWFYSTRFKREFVIGNLTVALLIVFTVLILPVYEPALYPFLRPELFFVHAGRKIINPLVVIAVYAFFAFVLTWMREVVKDLEDFKGDIEDGCVTMPIKIGLQKSVWFVLLLGSSGVVALSVASVRLLLSSGWYLLGGYIVLWLILPLLYFLYLLPKRHTRFHFKRMSRVLKLIMIPGILSLLLYWLIQY